jgi:acyl carrier protein
MSETPTFQRVRALLSEYTGVPESALRADSTPETTEGWDSAANLYLFAAIEEEFGVTVGTRDILRLRSLADIAAYLESAASQPATGAVDA